jgi:hypothetical protein
MVSHVYGGVGSGDGVVKSHIGDARRQVLASRASQESHHPHLRVHAYCWHVGGGGVQLHVSDERQQSVLYVRGFSKSQDPHKHLRDISTQPHCCGAQTGLTGSSGDLRHHNGSNC